VVNNSRRGTHGERFRGVLSKTPRIECVAFKTFKRRFLGSAGSRRSSALFIIHGSRALYEAQRGAERLSAVPRREKLIRRQLTSRGTRVHPPIIRQLLFMIPCAWYRDVKGWMCLGLPAWYAGSWHVRRPRAFPCLILMSFTDIIIAGVLPITRANVGIVVRYQILLCPPINTLLLRQRFVSLGRSRVTRTADRLFACNRSSAWFPSIACWFYKRFLSSYKTLNRYT